MLFQIKNKIRYADPLIYKIDGEHYYMGAMLFRKCTKDEIEEYEKLKTEFERLEKLPYPVKKCDCINLYNHFDNIIAVKSPEYKDAEHTKTMEQIQRYIETVSNDTQCDWLHQYDMYQKIMNYRKGKFR